MVTEEERIGLGDLIHKMLVEYVPVIGLWSEEDRKEVYMQNGEYFEAYTALNEYFPDTKPKKEDS